jgi:hypothetical protein
MDKEIEILENIIKLQEEKISVLESQIRLLKDDNEMLRRCLIK